MQIQNFFNRHEIKYLITKTQYQKFLEEMRDYLVADEYGKSLICNIYYDTPDFRLIRKSIEKPLYKEKLRLRSYGIPNDSSNVFIEIKKKYKSVVYKRRVKMTLNDANKFLKNPNAYSQITHEISYLIDYYERLYPALLLSYNRESFYEKNNRNFRITFDTNILWRNYDVDMRLGEYGKNILPEGTVLMEIKVDMALPLWMTSFLTKEKIYPCSFSKYGKAYLLMIDSKTKEYEL